MSQSYTIRPNANGMTFEVNGKTLSYAVFNESSNGFWVKDGSMDSLKVRNQAGGYDDVTCQIGVFILGQFRYSIAGGKEAQPGELVFCRYTKIGKTVFLDLKSKTRFANCANDYFIGTDPLPAFLTPAVDVIPVHCLTVLEPHALPAEIGSAMLACQNIDANIPIGTLIFCRGLKTDFDSGDIANFFPATVLHYVSSVRFIYQTA